MAINSVGYDGTVTESQWSILSPYQGAPYAISGANDLAVTANASATLAVNIAVGSAYGYGVLDTNTAQITLALGTIASGTRWDLIAMRRNWNTNTSAVVAIPGTATKVVPSRNTTPGTLDDQPLALVQVTAGQTVPTAVVDLRVFPGKTFTTTDLMGLPSDVATRGAQAYVGATHYRRDYDITQNLAWLSDAAIIPVGTDLNTITGLGIYTQGTSANATALLNYPTATNGAGFLEVFNQPGASQITIQRYTTYGNGTITPRLFLRSTASAGTWSAWQEYGLQDAGWVTTGFTPATGWANSGCKFRRLNGVTFVWIKIQLTQATAITASATGHLADATILTVPTGARPTDDWMADFKGSTNNGEVQLLTDGSLVLVSMNPSSSLSTSDFLLVTTSFPSN